MTTTRPDVVDRLCHATNAHDLDALEACFAPDYRNVTPVHPARGFVGSAQVRKNWDQLFAAMPDLRSHIVARVTDADVVWSEWEMRGTRPDGGVHLMRGVIVFSTASDRIASARFYLEPVDPGSEDIDATIGSIVTSDTTA